MPALLTLQAGMTILAVIISAVTLGVKMSSSRQRLHPELSHDGRIDYVYLYCRNPGSQPVHVDHYDWLLNGSQMPPPPCMAT